MQILDAAATKALLPFPALADELAAVLRDKKAGKTSAPPRLNLPLPGGVLFLMPASDGQRAIAKLVSVHAANSASNLSVVQADLLVINASTGERLLLLDGATVTAQRTAALSVLAAKKLAPNLAGPLLIVGAGVQARAHLEAFVAGLGLHDVSILARDQTKAAALVDYARRLGANAKLLADNVARFPLIVTATSSPTPVLPGNIQPETFIAAVGAYSPDMAELPPELVRAARLFVDTMEGAQSEAGDLIQANIDWSTVTAIEDALDTPRPNSGPVVFKSVGHALWDLAAARLAVSKL